MKRMNGALKAFMAMAVIALFAQCNNSGNANVSGSSVAGNAGTTGMKIAYVDVDTLLTKYNFWNDLNEMMMRKEENARLNLNEKAKAFENEAKDFQRKLENNVYTRERAESEQARLQKKQMELQELQNRLANELQQEQQKNMLQLRDSINSFLKSYNKDKGYSLIISNTQFDNLLYADPMYNITQEIVDGLNKRYKPSSEK